MWDKRAPRGLSLWQGFLLILTQPPGQRASGRAGVRERASESLGGPFPEHYVGWQAVLGAWVLSAPRTAPLGTTKWKSPALGDWKEAQGADLSPTSHTPSHVHTCGTPSPSLLPTLKEVSLTSQERTVARAQPGVLATAAEEAPPPR